ncbi:PaaI family thioesterase [Delftia tsuruhatensis]|uniref:PaaI family thioesterase n=1 Tax=Delftia tsuruhatensis TaxID=180282 RepID=UPI0022608177|nr:PaaI family thioesterase [Delftia tsuruhatensis]MCX7507811.1 PaaI family thioesterase [Delftia tsuruhatensis]
MHLPSTYLPVLDYLQRQIEGRLAADEATHMRYPTAISQMLGFRIVAVGEAMAVVEFDADAQRHGNQQGTVHGGMLCELADAAIDRKNKKCQKSPPGATVLKKCQNGRKQLGGLASEK